MCMYMGCALFITGVTIGIIKERELERKGLSKGKIERKRKFTIVIEVWFHVGDLYVGLVRVQL